MLWTEEGVPEFVAVQLRALKHFIGLGQYEPAKGLWPKKAELLEYFKQQRLSNGTFISKRKAFDLATNCRTVDAMKGGNRKVKREG